jgi:glycosyltransferase involved in cell wall biosynthesis
VEAPRFADRRQVVAEYARAAVLVQPRPVDQHFVRFSFPSKLMEYLASGTPVVSTRLPGIPADYDAHLYWAEDSTEGLASAIAKVLRMPSRQRRERAAAARDFIWSTRGFPTQGRRMREFLGALVERKR